MGFRFSIGDLVCFKITVAMCAPSERAPAFQVIERLTVECHGGTQYLYTLRGPKSVERYTNVCDLELERVEDARATTVELLTLAKESAVADQEWKIAKEIKDICDKVKAKKTPVASEPAQTTGEGT